MIRLLKAYLATHVTHTPYEKAQKRKDNAFIVQQGCLPIRKILDGNLPFGIDLVKGLAGAMANHQLMFFFESYTNEIEPTLELRMLGNAGLVTTDPENIKSVLSKSKLREGELGTLRSNLYL